MNGITTHARNAQMDTMGDKENATQGSLNAINTEEMAMTVSGANLDTLTGIEDAGK